MHLHGLKRWRVFGIAALLMALWAGISAVAVRAQDAPSGSPTATTQIPAASPATETTPAAPTETAPAAPAPVKAPELSGGDTAWVKKR